MTEKTSRGKHVLLSVILLLVLTAGSLGVGTLLIAGRAGLILPAALILSAVFAAVAWVVGYQPWQMLLQCENKLIRLETIDEMTGLQTRPCILERLVVEINRAMRGGQPLSCALVDIDHLRQTNSRFGQAAGDSVLRWVGNLIAESCRQYDSAGRYGGEEFLVILPDTEMDDAARATERLRRRIEQGQFACHGEGFTVTVSIGVTQYDLGASETADVLIARANNALENAKVEGRNRVSALATLAFVERASTPVPATASR